MDFSYSKCTVVAPESLLPYLGAEGVRVDRDGWTVVGGSWWVDRGG